MKMLEDLEEVVRLDGPEGRYDAACIKALRLIRTHAAEIERNAMDAERRDGNIKAAQLILRDIWETWYPGNEWNPGDNIQTLLSQIFNSLWGVPDFAKTVDARLGMQNAIDDAMRGGGE